MHPHTFRVTAPDDATTAGEEARAADDADRVAALRQAVAARGMPGGPG